MLSVLVRVAEGAICGQGFRICCDRSEGDHFVGENDADSHKYRREKSFVAMYVGASLIVLRIFLRDLSHKFRSTKAQECSKFAAAAVRSKEKLFWSKLAEEWLALADIPEKEAKRRRFFGFLSGD